MRYLFLLYGPDGPLPAPGSPEGQQMISEWRTATEAMAKAGVLIEGIRVVRLGVEHHEFHRHAGTVPCRPRSRQPAPGRWSPRPAPRSAILR